MVQGKWIIIKHNQNQQHALLKQEEDLKSNPYPDISQSAAFSFRIKKFPLSRIIGFVSDLLFSSTSESGLKIIRIRCRIRRMRVDGSCIRNQKVANSKISGYLWTGPECHLRTARSFLIDEKWQVLLVWPTPAGITKHKHGMVFENPIVEFILEAFRKVLDMNRKKLWIVFRRKGCFSLGYSCSYANWIRAVNVLSFNGLQLQWRSGKFAKGNIQTLQVLETCPLTSIIQDFYFFFNFYYFATQNNLQTE